MKYSILMPYYDRADQLASTLQSFERLYGGRDDFEVFVIEDFKNFRDKVLHNRLLEVLVGHQSLPLVHSVFPMSVTNPAPLFNWGYSHSNGKYLVLTNPECRHKNDVLSGFDVELDDSGDVYVVVACEGLDKDGNFDRWYQHSKHRNVKYHFCSCISRSSYRKAGGFPGYFYDGLAYDDDAFLLRVEKLGIPIVVRDDIVVQHQWHTKDRIDRELLQLNEKRFKSMIR